MKKFIYLFMILAINSAFSQNNIIGKIKFSDNTIQKKFYSNTVTSITSYCFIDSSKVAMLDGSEGKIIIYSFKENKILNNISIQFNALDFDIYSNNYYVLYDNKVSIINENGNTINEFTYRKPIDSPFSIEKFKVIGGRCILNVSDGSSWIVCNNRVNKINNLWSFNDGYEGSTEKIDNKNFLLTINSNTMSSEQETLNIREYNLNDYLATVKIISIKKNKVVLDIETTNNIDNPRRFLIFTDLSGKMSFKTEIPFIYDTDINISISNFLSDISYCLSTPDELIFYDINSNKKQIIPPDNCPSKIHFNNNLLKKEIDNTDNLSKPMKVISLGTNSVTRTQVYENAYKFRDLEWTATSSNIQKSCSTISGLYFVTPSWVTLGANTGVPYKWGGWTDWTNFSDLASQGKYAGNCATTSTQSPCSQSPYASSSDTYIIGDDCSGFVSRCWETSTKYSTSGLPSICTDLGSATNSTSFTQLQVGDIINYQGSHTRLCLTQNPNGTATFMESSAADWKVNNRSYSYTQLSGYKCLRYNNISDARLRLAQSITINPTTVVRGSPLTISYKIGNYGTESWTGYVRIYVIQSDGNEMALQTQGPITLNAGSVSNTYSFTSNSVSSPAGATQLVVRVLNNNSGDYGRYYNVGNGGYSNPFSFTINQGSNYTISATSNPTNGGTTSGTGTFSNGTSCTLKATVNTGYTFYNWTENGTVVSTSASYNFTVTDNRTLVANFTSNNYTVSVLANPSAAGTVLGRGDYNYGSQCTLNAVANSGYTFSNWTENGTVVSTSASYTFTVTGSRTLVANFTSNTYTVSVSANPSTGGTVSGGGSATYGTSKTVTATANSGYTFTNWTENGTVVSTNASYTFTVISTCTLVANFVQSANYTISLSSNPVAGGATTGGGTYASGVSRTVTATPNTGYIFNNWTENGAIVSSNASYTFTVISTRTLVANFVQSANYTISLSSNPVAGGATTGGGTYASGVSRTVTATPNTGYIFNNWTENGAVVSSNASYTFTLNANKNLVANFSPISYTVSASASPVAGGSIIGAGSYNYGTSCTLTATANTGYTFSSWTENGIVVSTNASLSFTVSSPRTFVANFTSSSTGNIINGLVAYYKFDGNANDFSGNANNGVDVVGVSYLAGKYGQCAKFGGYSNPCYIRVPNSATLQFANEASFAYWVRLDDAAGMDGWGSNVANGNHCVFAKDFDYNGIYNNMGYTNKNTLYSNIGSSGGGGGISTKSQGIANYIIGNWVHVAFVSSSSSSTVYINGVMDSTVNKPINYATSNTRDLYFGRYQSFWYPLNGALDEVRIYNRALSFDEIQQIYTYTNTSINQVEDYGISIFSYNSNIIIENAEGWNVKVFDILGRTIQTRKIDAGKFEIPVNHIGVYAVLLTKDNKTCSHKIIVSK